MQFRLTFTQFCKAISPDRSELFCVDFTDLCISVHTFPHLCTRDLAREPLCRIQIRAKAVFGFVYCFGKYNLVRFAFQCKLDRIAHNPASRACLEHLNMLLSSVWSIKKERPLAQFTKRKGEGCGYTMGWVCVSLFPIKHTHC